MLIFSTAVPEKFHTPWWMAAESRYPR